MQGTPRELRALLTGGVWRQLPAHTRPLGHCQHQWYRPRLPSRLLVRTVLGMDVREPGRHSDQHFPLLPAHRKPPKWSTSYPAAAESTAALETAGSPGNDREAPPEKAESVLGFRRDVLPAHRQTLSCLKDGLRGVPKRPPWKHRSFCLSPYPPTLLLPPRS